MPLPPSGSPAAYAGLNGRSDSMLPTLSSLCQIPNVTVSDRRLANQPVFNMRPLIPVLTRRACLILCPDNRQMSPWIGDTGGLPWPPSFFANFLRITGRFSNHFSFFGAKVENAGYIRVFVRWRQKFNTGPNPPEMGRRIERNLVVFSSTGQFSGNLTEIPCHLSF